MTARNATHARTRNAPKRETHDKRSHYGFPNRMIRKLERSKRFEMVWIDDIPCMVSAR